MHRVHELLRRRPLGQKDGDGAAQLPPVPDVTDDDEVLRWDMQPGDALLFNSSRLHGDGREIVDDVRAPARLRDAVVRRRRTF